MKKRMRSIITIGLGLGLALFSAALTFSTPPLIKGNPGNGVFFMQPTATPRPEELSKVGSTDGIALMGIVIALIVIIPILLRRKSWLAP
jgi:hypothetical protein